MKFSSKSSLMSSNDIKEPNLLSSQFPRAHFHSSHFPTLLRVPIVHIAPIVPIAPIVSIVLIVPIVPIAPIVHRGGVSTGAALAGGGGRGAFAPHFFWKLKQILRHIEDTFYQVPPPLVHIDIFLLSSKFLYKFFSFVSVVPRLSIVPIFPVVFIIPIVPTAPTVESLQIFFYCHQSFY